MSTWIFEPGHTEAEFRARHMMVTWVRGLFKDIHGRLELDLDRCLDATFEGEIDATGIWTGEPTRDAHLRSADFFDVENHPGITFAGRFTERTADTAFKGEVDLTIRATTKTVPLDIAYLGEWVTPFWEGDENKGDMRRVGFEATTRIDRHDFGVSWQDEIPGGGVVVSNEIELVLDVEAILLDDLERTGAMSYCRESWLLGDRGRRLHLHPQPAHGSGEGWVTRTFLDIESINSLDIENLWALAARWATWFFATTYEGPATTGSTSTPRPSTPGSAQPRLRREG